MDVDGDYKVAIGWNRYNLNILGVWPDPGFQETGLLRFRFIIISLLMIIFITGPQTASLVLVWGNAELMTENLVTANISVSNACIKMLFVWYHKNALRSLMSSFAKDWYGTKTEKERSAMLGNAKIGKKISVWCTVVTQMMIMSFIAQRMFTILTTKSEVDEVRLVPYPAYFPYDLRRSPSFELTCLGQAVSGICASISYSSIDTFISMLVIHVCGQFSNLRSRLENLADSEIGGNGAMDFQRELAWIVERHEHLNWFSKTIEECFSLLLLLQMLCCTVQLCFLCFMLYKILTSGGETNVLQMGFMAVSFFFLCGHLYLYCYVGEMLIVESSGVGVGAYCAKWYNMPSNHARCISFIMHRSTIPVCLTAGKFGTFSMEMFSNIVKTSLGYLSVLLTVTDSDD